MLKTNSFLRRRRRRRRSQSVPAIKLASITCARLRNAAHARQRLATELAIIILILTTCTLVVAAAVGQSTGGSEEPPASSGPFVFQHKEQERDSQYWLASGRAALDQALRYEPVVERARNAIIFIGDGMSLSTITAARILHGQLMNKSGEEDAMSFEQLSNVALIKTYNIDQQVPDSAATATAILTGVKANFYTLGVNGNVRLNDTNCARIQANKVSSLLRQAQEAGKSTGIITNTRITHATPAAAYAHTSNRRWECDPYVPKNLEAPCKDIARQLVEDEPGSRLNVVLGGGRRCFFGPNFIDPGPTGQPGMRQDGRNLINQWIAKRKANNEPNFAFVNSTQDLRLINANKTDYLLGLFSYSHMSYEELRDTTRYGEPSLTEMTEVAIKILSRNPAGYLLLIEGGRIDHAHHENVAGVALRETIALSWAVQRAREMISDRETLLAVTSDHAHALTINGIAPRGNPILGMSRYKENSTQMPYTTLIYGNGPGNQRPRADPSQGGPTNSTESPYYVQYAAIHQEEAFHDGTDVAIFASGPFAHLFQGVQEQSYIAHVFAYAMCLGDYVTSGAHCVPSSSSSMSGRTISSNPSVLNELASGGGGAADQLGDAASTRLSYADSPLGPTTRNLASPGHHITRASSRLDETLPSSTMFMNRRATSGAVSSGATTTTTTSSILISQTSFNVYLLLTLSIAWSLMTSQMTRQTTRTRTRTRTRTQTQTQTQTTTKEQI